jgi:hypothetical protein
MVRIIEEMMMIKLKVAPPKKNPKSKFSLPSSHSIFP